MMDHVAPVVGKEWFTPHPAESTGVEPRPSEIEAHFARFSLFGSGNIQTLPRPLVCRLRGVLLC